MMFRLGPFAPRADLPADWRDLLKEWVSGADVTQRGPDAMTVIDEAFVYRLVWAVEAIRVRKNLMTSSEIIEGGATAALETGVPLMTMAMLIRAGLPSRRAAIRAIESTSAGFLDGREMMDWMRSTEIEQLTASGAWPTPDTASIWREFRAGLLSGTDGKWTRTTRAIGFDQGSIISQPEQDRPYRVDWDEASSSYWVCEPDFRRVAKLENAPRWWASAVVYCIYSGQESEFLVDVTGLAEE
jgi:hypothetical protein